MKKYAIVIGEDNAELSRRVQEALIAVGMEQTCGFGAIVKNKRCPILTVRDGLIDASSLNYQKEWDGYTLLPSSYVIAHASDLDGAKKQWEIPPKGYRLITDEERAKHTTPNLCMHWMNTAWVMTHNYGCEMRFMYSAYAVPIGFKFEPEVVEMTMDEVCKELGKTVKIVKDKNV